jgi:glutathione S-transferase
MSLPRLIYFASRGRAEVIRLVLAETDVSYEEEGFEGKEAFAALKASGRLPFLAVPVWEETGFRLAQSAAIANHIARAHGLRGASSKEEALIDQALGAVEDVRNEFRRISPAEPAKRPEIRAELRSTTLPRWFGHLERLLVSNNDGEEFLVGKSISVADFALWYLLEIARDNDFGSTLHGCARLNAFFERTARRPRIAAYLGSPRRWPLQKLPS